MATNPIIPAQLLPINEPVTDQLTSKEISPFLWEKMEDYAQAGLEGAANTRRAYAADLRDFTTWCERSGQSPLPVSALCLAAYMVHLAETCQWATLNRRLSAITKLHELKGYECPKGDKQFRSVMEGIKRKKGIRQKQAPAFKMPTLKAILKGLDTNTSRGLRDKALLLIGFTGAFRRSELVSLNLEDLHFSEDGLLIALGKSKTNQYGDHEEKAFYFSPDGELCPVRTLKRWIEGLGRTSGPVFVRVRKGDQLTEKRLTALTVYDLVKKHLGARYSAHSLRASFVTIAKLNGADDSEVMRQTKHKTSLMIQRYTRIEDIRLHNAAMKLGL